MSVVWSSVWVSARLMKLDRPDTSALTMELGIHNCLLAIGIALNPQLLNSIAVATPAALYVVSMYITALPLAYWFRNRTN
jgi:BASS family bile acid:Na+ symporter